MTTTTEQLSKPIRLSDGTEIFETVQVKSVYAMSGFGVHQRPFRRRNPQSEEDVQAIKEEEVDISFSKKQFAGGKAIPIDTQILQVSRHAYDLQEHPLFYDEEEIPYERYARLRMELHRFTQDLQEYSKENNNEIEQRTVSMLLQSLKQITRNLEQLRSQTSYAPYFDNTFNYRLDSIKNIQLQKLGQKIREFKVSANNHNNQSEKEQKNDMQVFQLYRGEHIETALGSVDYQFITAEERISRLERLVGLVADMSNPFPDVTCAVKYLESKYRVFDDQCGEIKSACQKMASDIKAISYTFANLTLTIQKTISTKQPEKTQRNRRMTNNERKEMIERYKQFEKLDYLWTIMHKWDPMVFELIRIVNRFITLQSYHHRSVLLCDRVKLLNKQQGEILKSLRDDNQTLKSILDSMQQNKLQTDKNIAYVKHRISYLEGKVK